MTWSRVEPPLLPLPGYGRGRGCGCCCCCCCCGKSWNCGCVCCGTTTTCGFGAARCFISSHPYSYLPFREGKQVTNGDEVLALAPHDEASYMKPAVILTVLNEELRKLEEQDTKTHDGKRAA
jgi:hypothetical protein